MTATSSNAWAVASEPLHTQHHHTLPPLLFAAGDDGHEQRRRGRGVRPWHRRRPRRQDARAPLAQQRTEAMGRDDGPHFGGPGKGAARAPAAPGGAPPLWRAVDRGRGGKRDRAGWVWGGCGAGVRMESEGHVSGRSRCASTAGWL
eukprot:359366-Chlamydomonas_euryale.AAC.2